MEYLKLGTIIKTRGLKGNVKIFSTSDFSSERYQKGKKVFVRNNENSSIKEMEILDYSFDNQFDYVTFKGYESIEEITPFLKHDILIIKEEHPLPEGVFYHQDLQQCFIYENNQKIAEVISVEEYSSYKSLRIKYFHNNKVFLLPFIDTFIKNVDLDNKRIDVSLIEGMK